MKHRVRCVFLFSWALLSLSSDAQAEELSYRPVNPAFGGNPLNASFLLSTAAEQRPERNRETQSAIDRFEESITSSILAQASTQIASQILGENAAESGRFQIGSTNIEFQREGDQVRIVLGDLRDPDRRTEISIPTSGLLQRGRNSLQETRGLGSLRPPIQ